MKKILMLLALVFCLTLTGCGKYGEKDLIKDLSKKINNSKGYYLNGTLEMVNNDDKYSYDVNVSYSSNDNFKVSLKNKNNNHEQIILRNGEGVYVLTPSLNKSFKFQSEWPYNNSQSYILQNIMNDIKNDKNLEFKTTKDGYTITTTVDYPSNKDLKSQIIYIDKKLNIKKVEVLDKNKQVHIKMTFESIDLKATYNDKYFTLKENMASATIEETETTSKIEDIIYPMYMPANTRLTGQDTVAKEDGERIILTFDGDKPFMLVQETVSKDDELTTVLVDGEPLLIADSVAAVNDYSINWVSNGIEYYVVSSDMDSEELISVAASIAVMPVSK
ncbi:MAG: hypothetical protein V8Q75_00285 [Bacilli bacterium]